MKLTNLKRNKKIAIGAFTVLCIVVSLSFCNIDSSSNYLSKVESSEYGFTTEKQIQKVKFSIRYFSPTYMTIRQFKKDDKSISYSDLKKDFAQTLDFGFRIDLPSDINELKKIVNNTSEYQSLIDYLAFRIQEDILLLVDDREFNCNFVHFERNYDTAPFIQLQFGFNKTLDLIELLENEEDVSIKFNADHFDLGPIYFQFKNTIITDNPTIIF